MLMGAGFPLPKLKIHGFLTINGVKMSKSRGTFINARTYLKHLDPQYLRYYYACKIGPESSDIDMNLDDLVARINADLVGKLANLPSRSATMLRKRLDGRLGKIPDDARDLIDRLKGASEELASFYERVEFGETTKKICQLADEVNRYIDDRKPWVQIKDDPEGARGTITATLNATRILSIYLKPILPDFAKKVEDLLGENDLQWVDLQADLEGVKIGAFKRLVERVDPERVQAMVEGSKETTAHTVRKEKKMVTPVCSYDDFMKVDLRIARVLEAASVEGADKLLRMKLDIGEGEQRTVFAGIKTAYKPEDLIGRLVVAVINLEHRKMKFGTSEAMVLASGEGGKDIHLIFPDQGAEPGQRVH
jgi:methionyl-tRNA synthetase